MNRAERRRRAREEHKAKVDDLRAVNVAFTPDDNEDDIALAKQLTHDALVAQLGPDQRGPVSWQLHTGVSRTLVIAELSAEQQEAAQAYFAEHPDGTLVVAQCAGVRRAT